MLEKLNNVQDLDLKLDVLQADLGQVPPNLISTRQQKIDLNETLKKILGEHGELRQDLSRNELELEGLESRRRQASEGSLRAGSAKEASQFQNQELQFATRIQELEEDTLPLIESVDRVSAVATTLEQDLEELEPRLQSLTQTEADRIYSIDQRLTSVRAERDALASIIDAKLLKQYEQVRRARRGLGLVTIQESKMCGGCTMKLPIHIVQKTRAGKAVTRCPSCGRILWNRN